MFAIDATHPQSPNACADGKLAAQDTLPSLPDTGPNTNKPVTRRAQPRWFTLVITLERKLAEPLIPDKI